MSQTTITISDRGQALIALDTEAENISREIRRMQEDIRTLTGRIEGNRTRLRVIHEAMKSIHADGVYYLRDF